MHFSFHPLKRTKLGLMCALCRCTLSYRMWDIQKWHIFKSKMDIMDARTVNDNEEWQHRAIEPIENVKRKKLRRSCAKTQNSNNYLKNTTYKFKMWTHQLASRVRYIYICIIMFSIVVFWTFICNHILYHCTVNIVETVVFVACVCMKMKKFEMLKTHVKHCLVLVVGDCCC